MDKKNALRSESVLNQNTVKLYTDGWKPDGRVGAGFYAEYPNYSTVFQAEVLGISEVAKNPLLKKKCTIKVLVCWLIVKQLSKHP